MAPAAWGFDINNASDFHGSLPDAVATWSSSVEALLVLERYDEARKEAEERLASTQSSGDEAGAAGALHALAKLHSTQNRHAPAKEAAEGSVARFRAAGDARGVALGLLTSAKIALDMREGKRAEELAREAAEKYSAAGSKAGEAAAQLVLARTHQRESEAEEALEVADKARALFEKCGDKEGQAAALLVKGNVFLWHYRDAQDEASKLGREASLLLKKTDRPSCHHREGDALFLVASAALAVGKHREGLKAAREAVELHGRWGGPRAKASSLRAVGMAHVQLGNLSDADEAVDESLSLLRGTSDEVLQAEAMVVQALILRQKVAKDPAHDVDEMITKHREVLECFLKLEDEHAAALHRLELAQALQLAGDSSVALTEATIACEFFKSKDVQAGQGMCMMTIAMCQVALGEAKTALETAKKAKSTLEGCGGSYPECAELIAILTKQSGERGGQTWSSQREWGSYETPVLKPVVEAGGDSAGVKRSMYSDIVKARIHQGDTPDPISFDSPMLLYMDRFLGVQMPFIRDVPPPPGALGASPAAPPPPPPPRSAAPAAPRPAAPGQQMVPAGEERQRPPEQPKAPIVIKPVVVGNDMLGGRYRDCPEEVHARMVQLARGGAVPLTTLPQRSALERKKPTFHGHAEWRDAVRWGYIHPTIKAPRDCKWAKASVGWKLTGPSPSELLAN